MIVAPSVSAVRVPLMLAIAGVVRVLLVRVTLALFLAASLVLSTFPSPTSHFTIPVGVVIAGDVIVCTPMKLLSASVRATVKFASGRVIVRAAVGQENVSN